MTTRERDYFRSMLDDMSREFYEIERTVDNMFNAVRSMPPGKLGADGPYYYGFSVTVGPNGRPSIREFGNVKPTGMGQVAIGTREPMVEAVLDDKQNIVRLAAEMPGVTKDDIKVKATDSAVTISAEKGDVKYYTEVDLPAAVDPNSAEATYNNGVLELKFKLKEPAQSKGTEIKVK